MLANVKQVLILDFETRWDKKEYSLTKTPNEAYVRDPRFKAFGVGYKWYGDDAAPKWVTGRELASFFSGIEWGVTAVVAHNAMFDCSILSWVYGHVPCIIFDTLSMARALRGVEGGNSLERLAQDYGLPPKGKALHSTDGLEDLPPEVEDELAEYCCHDVYLCEEVFKRLSDGFPRKELEIIDLTLKMFVSPVLELNKDILEKAIAEEESNRTSLLQRLRTTDKDLASGDKFASLLSTLGVLPPTKISRTTKKQIWAFAKTDAEFQALINSDREDVSILCEARLLVKSTLERTRAQRFLDIAKRGTLPVPLHYFGSHTGRWSAARGSALNLQNLKRGSFLRQSIHAPDGHVLVVGDLSQIEVRVLASLCGNEDLLEIFKELGADPYAVFGRTMFGIPELTKESHPVLRQSSKSAVLGCGYGLGFANFAAQLLVGFLGAPPVRYGVEEAKQIGVTVRDIERFMSFQPFVDMALAIPHTCIEEELLIHTIAAKKIIDKYRAASPAVTDFWAYMQELLERCLVGGEVETVKCLTFSKGQIQLPSGMALRYPDLQGEEDEKGRMQWSYWTGKKRKKIYGGSITENICQAVARIIMSDAMVKISRNYKIVSTVHDELVVLAKEKDAEMSAIQIKAAMVAQPSYLEGIPLDASVSYARSYGEAK